MSWHYSRELVEEFSAANCLDGEPSAQWNVNPTPQACLSPDRMMAFSRLSRFGMTFAPFQDISNAGKGAGINGERSGLWYEMLRIIGEVAPEYAFIENSPNLRSKGLVTILQGLDKIGYNAAWDIISAKEHGANHERKRMWILAKQRNRDVSNTYMPQCERGGIPCGGQKKNTYPRMETWWKTSPALDRVDDGVAARMDRLKAIGNGQVPLVAASAFYHLKQQLDN